MNKSLPEKSQIHESRITEITDIIVKTAKDKIAFVILFGPFASGSWVRYKYNEAGVNYEYNSAYDFLIITKSAKSISGSNFNLERKIRKKINSSALVKDIHPSHIIIESVSHVNEEIEKCRDFFCDIRKDGILLYDSGEFELSDLGSKKKKIDKSDYEHWFKAADGFLADYKHALQRSDYKKASFYLHQAAENLYNCTLLTLGGYKPKSHDLEELNRLCTFYSNDFLTVFPRANKDQKECFELLQQSYINARYSKFFCINKGQLEYLTTRVEKLKEFG